MKSIWFVFLMLIVTFSTSSQADPWFLGPLLMDSAQVMPLGSVDLAVSLQNSYTNFYYNNQLTAVPNPLATTGSLVTSIAVGVATDVDFILVLLSEQNKTNGFSANNLGDTFMELGFQVLTQGDDLSRPDCRITIQELFPTGRYNRLNPTLEATDATGAGSYQTSLGLSFDLLAQFPNTHYLRSSASVVGTYASTATLHGSSIYGGSDLTRGHISPGNSLAFDIAGEYTLTQNWVAVLEGFFLIQKASDFEGYLGPNPASVLPRSKEFPDRPHLRPTRHNIGSAQSIGSGNLSELSMAPALEYNFSDSMGILASVWFTTGGKNSAEFISGALSFSISW